MNLRTALCLFLCAGGVPAFAYTGCPGDTNIVAEYIFHDDAYNTGSDDGIGDLILTNGVTFSTDVPPANTNCGYSVSLPATGSGGTTPALETAGSYDPLAGATQFVIMAWVKRESAASNNNTSARIASDESSTSLASNSGFAFRFSGSAGTLALRVNENELSTSVGGIPPNEGEWHHVAVVYDGARPATNALTRHAHFYVDGVQRGLGVSNSTLHVAVNANDSRLTIGNSAVGRGVGNLLVGKIDDVRVLKDFAPEAVGDNKTNEVILCFMNSKDDFEPPTIAECASGITVNTDAGQCIATITSLGTVTASDNCGTINITNDAPAVFPLGVTLVTWTVTDANGNSTNCQQSVTVLDNEPPSIACSNMIVDAGACMSAVTNLNLIGPAISDNCGISSLSSNPPAQYVMGTNTVTWTVFDTSGNSAQCQQLVIVVPSTVADCDGDGLTDWEEVHLYQTDWNNPDTDGDGMSDLFEVQYGLNPNSNSDAACRPRYW